MTVGLRDVFTSRAGDGPFTIEADSTWGGTVAVNAYTGERVSVAGKVRSYDVYSVGTLHGTPAGDALFSTTAGSGRVDANGVPVASPAHFASVDIFVMGGGDDVLDLTAGAGGAASLAYGASIYGDTGPGESGSNAGDDVLWGGGSNDIIYGDFQVGGPGGDDVLDGGAGNDILFGDGQSALTTGGAADRIEGGTGDDLLFGDAQYFASSATRGADDFVFRADSGRDTVGDLRPGIDDILVSTAAYGFDSFDDLTITDGPGGAVVTLDGTADRITLTGVSAASLTAADFEFF